MRRCSAALLAAALLIAGCGGRAQADDGQFHQVASQGRTGAEVTFDATMVAAPERVGTHEHLLVRAATGETVEVDHNLDLSRWVPAQVGDHLVISGQFYDDSGREGVHCTHAHTSSGCPVPGWIELGSTYYE